MYRKYHTEAIVLGSRETGESDRVFHLFTREFGLVYARASAVRAESSRMRYALQHYGRTEVSLVRGKRGWRAAGARALAGVPPEIRALGAFARLCRLALRLLPAEEQSPYLFAALAEAHEALSGEAAEAHAAVEIVCAARLLYALGYLSAEALDTTLLSHTAYGLQSLAEAEAARPALLSSINKAIAETHL